MLKPTEIYWKVVKRILRYLVDTLYHGICFSTNLNCYITTYYDTGHASCPDDRRSTSGYYVYLGNNLVSWSSTKQKVVSQFSIESEYHVKYHAVENVVAKLVWLLRLLVELGLILQTTPILYCDNLNATYLPANSNLHACTKHVEIDHHSFEKRSKITPSCSTCTC